MVTKLTETCISVFNLGGYMSVSLSAFPVQIPDGFNWDAAPVIQRQGRSGDCVKEIIVDDNFNGARPNGHIHHGIDIFGAIGLRVVSATAGKVVESWIYNGNSLPGAGWSTRSGNYVRIIDPNGYVHYYAHLLTSPLVKSGDPVNARQLIGYLGNTGECGCPHLHYQVRAPYPLKPNNGGTAEDPRSELLRLQPTFIVPAGHAH